MLTEPPDMLNAFTRSALVAARNSDKKEKSRYSRMPPRATRSGPSPMAAASGLPIDLACGGFSLRVHSL